MSATSIFGTRKNFPDADIEVVTNGLLILKQDAELFSVMRKNRVGFHISQYIPTVKIKKVIEKKCKVENVDYFFERGVIVESAKHLSMTGDSDNIKEKNEKVNSIKMVFDIFKLIEGK